MTSKETIVDNPKFFNIYQYFYNKKIETIKIENNSKMITSIQVLRLQSLLNHI